MSSLPPAPFRGPSKKETLKLLSNDRCLSRLPLTLGEFSPQAVILVEEGRWRLRELTADHTKRDQIARAQSAKGYYMPEHDFGALVAGRVLIDASSREELVAQVKKIPWTFGGAK